MLSKKIISLIMVVTLLLTMAVIPATYAVSQDELEPVSVNTASDYGLASSIQNGNILHAFNWKMSEIKEYAPQIAAAGYTTVQISPIQQTKAAGNAGSYATDWWSFYQPTDMRIGNDLGNEADLKAMCTELHKYGIKVIADVVTNHVQNCESRADQNKINATLRGYCRRTPTGTLLSATDASRNSQTKNDLDAQLPDLKTEDTGYQQYVITNLLNPMLNAGVDGFRFDAAKHIETPDDGADASQYWPNVTNAIKQKNSNAFIYGEVLDSAGKFNISSYTKYMSVTDFKYGATVRSALTSKSASSLPNYGYSGSSKNQNVLWVESHDTFCDSTSTKLTRAQQIQGWAIVGSRKDAPALFFIRSNCESLDSKGFIKYDEYIGAPGAAPTWKDKTVVAVNKFKNFFQGKSETVTANGSYFCVQRDKTGMVIVNIGGGAGSVNQSCSMNNGSYVDRVSGNTFQVSGGKITGTLGSSGVAVIYNEADADKTPVITAKLGSTEIQPTTLFDYNSSVKVNNPNNRYTTATADVTFTLADAKSGTIDVNGVKGTLKNGSNKITLKSSIPFGTIINITVTATSGNKTISNTYNIVKKNPSDAKVAYFDNTAMRYPVGQNTDGSQAGIYVFQKTGTAPSTKVGSAWPGKLLTVVSGNLYSATIDSKTNYVKFNEGFIPNVKEDAFGREHLFHSFTECQGYCGRTFPQTVIPYGSANKAANRENGGAQIVGEMIVLNVMWYDYLKNSAFTAKSLTASDVDGISGGTQPSTQPSTQAPSTQKPSETQQQPSVVPGQLKRGDADTNAIVDILDATAIQQHLAKLRTLNADGSKAADVDGADGITILDATYIQKYLANLGNPYNIGGLIAGSTTPTQAPATQAPQTEPEETEPEVQPTQPALKPLGNKFVACVYCEAFSTDETKRTKEFEFSTNGVLTMDFPDNSYVFVRNYDTGVQYCTDGWAGFVQSATLVNEHNLTGQFDKLVVPAGTHTLYLVDNGNDTYTLSYDTMENPGPIETYGDDDPSEGPVTGEAYDVYFSTKDWSQVYAYVWTDGGGEQQAWPGVPMTFVETNPYGEKVYKFTVQPQFDRIIYNNGKDGNSNQTVDLTLDGTPNTGYYISGTDSSGKKTCGTYVYGVES